jgi:hypothetical protein
MVDNEMFAKGLVGIGLGTWIGYKLLGWQFNSNDVTMASGVQRV